MRSHSSHRNAGAWDSPVALVQAFITDYYNWNARAIARDATEEALAAMDASEEDYAAVLVPYIRKGFVGQSIAYGTESAHDPALERIVSIEEALGAAIVRTETLGRSGFAHHYEYELSKNGGRWYLNEVWYVDADGKFRGL